MSDITHSRKAEDYLISLNGSVPEALPPHPGDVATIHAILAAPRALREIDTTLRQGLEKIATLLKGPNPTQIVYLTDAGGSSFWINARNLISISSDPDNFEQTVVVTADGTWTARGSVIDVSSTIFQVVGSW